MNDSTKQSRCCRSSGLLRSARKTFGRWRRLCAACAKSNTSFGRVALPKECVVDVQRAAVRIAAARRCKRPVLAAGNGLDRLVAQRLDFELLEHVGQRLFGARWNRTPAAQTVAGRDRSGRRRTRPRECRSGGTCKRLEFAERRSRSRTGARRRLTAGGIGRRIVVCHSPSPHTALTISSVIFLASPRSIMVLSR